MTGRHQWWLAICAAAGSQDIAQLVAIGPFGARVFQSPVPSADRSKVFVGEAGVHA